MTSKEERNKKILVKDVRGTTGPYRTVVLRYGARYGWVGLYGVRYDSSFLVRYLVSSTARTSTILRPVLPYRTVRGGNVRAASHALRMHAAMRTKRYRIEQVP